MTSHKQSDFIFMIIVVGIKMWLPVHAPGDPAIIGICFHLIVFLLFPLLVFNNLNIFTGNPPVLLIPINNNRLLLGPQPPYTMGYISSVKEQRAINSRVSIWLSVGGDKERGFPVVVGFGNCQTIMRREFPTINIEGGPGEGSEDA